MRYANADSLLPIQIQMVTSEFRYPQYDAALTCVRYKYDIINKKMIELIVESETWEINEIESWLIKSASDRWNREKKYREIPYKDLLTLGLENSAELQMVKKRKNA